MFVNELLNEKELLLQSGILVIELMNIQCAEVAYLGFLPHGVQYSVTHKQRARVDAKNHMFVYQLVNHSPYFPLILSEPDSTTATAPTTRV
jgi:hypothetical protein